MSRGFAVALAFVLWSASAFAHEVRPAYLELRETGPGEYRVLWKTPMVGDARLALDPDFGGRLAPVTPVATSKPGNAAVQTWSARGETLRGQPVAIRGLEGTMTDALVRVEFADGTRWTQRLTPSAPSATVPLRPSPWTVASVYFKLGVEHILLGIDHLLFVLALLLLVRGPWKIVKTVTAFTAAHSLTLALATLGVVHVPVSPVEALIALSIALVAVEIVRGRDGNPGIASRAPWIVAFAFGLLHGLGFAGALSEVGLPEGHIPLALLFFNLGVEAGQLLFIGAVLPVITLLRRVLAMALATESRTWRRAAGLIPAYLIGTIAMFWTIERISTF
jgi:hypothetical protein